MPDAIAGKIVHRQGPLATKFAEVQESVQNTGAILSEGSKVTDKRRLVDWTGRPLLAPFSWKGGHDVLLSVDIFASHGDSVLVDELFAVMALCPQHQFRLVTDFPERFHDYVRTITENREEWLTWRVSASSVLSELGRHHEATGHGPRWPLKNVALADFRLALGRSGPVA